MKLQEKKFLFSSESSKPVICKDDRQLLVRSSSACSSVASTSKTVWLLPQASAGSLRGSSTAAFSQTSTQPHHQEAAQHGVRDVERVHDGAA